MANRFFNPNEQFCDATGLPYAGGSLTFYASGTTTPLNTYSDKALTIANTNPVVLDSAGRAGSVFLQNLAYKVVLADVNSNVIWTFDPVYSSDFSTVAQFQSGNGSPNGVLAGTAGSATIPASSYWDAQNNILYVCTQTGNAATAVWTAINSGAAAAVVTPPQGYLTPTSGSPIIGNDVIGASTVFYTPYVGNLIPIYNGTSFTPTVFAEISCTLVSAHLANTIYDLFVFNNSGVLTLVTGPAWTSSGAGTSSRGTGSGTTQLSRINGLWVNTVSMTARNGSNTYTVPASQATYVGSILIDTTPGQVTLHRNIGQLRKWGLWNAYNRVPIILLMQDPSASWIDGGGSRWIVSDNGNTNNQIITFTGLAEEEIFLDFSQNVYFPSINNQTAQAAIAIGVDSTSGPATGSSIGSIELISSSASVPIASGGTVRAKCIIGPIIGLSTAYSMQNPSYSSGATISVTFKGGVEMFFTAEYRG